MEKDDKDISMRDFATDIQRKFVAYLAKFGIDASRLLSVDPVTMSEMVHKYLVPHRTAIQAGHLQCVTELAMHFGFSEVPDTNDMKDLHKYLECLMDISDAIVLKCP